jgi:DNA-binding IclR family transcriptional regulator
MSRLIEESVGLSADPYFLRAVAKAFEAVEVIRGSKEPIPLHVVAASIGLSKASAMRILHTLESLGYIRKRDDGYMSSDRQPPDRVVEELLQCAAEPLRRLAQTTLETASLCALFENHIEVVLVVESSQLIRMANTRGRILPPHASSMGKAVTAFQPAEVQERLLRSYGTARITDTTICELSAIEQELERIRQNGYAEDWGESTPDAVCFGAPILDAAGNALAAVSASMPRMRFDRELHQPALIKIVQATAAEISKTLLKRRGGARQA